MCKDALANANEKVRAGVDITLSRKWLSMSSIQTSVQANETNEKPYIRKSSKNVSILKRRHPEPVQQNTLTRSIVKRPKRNITNQEGKHLVIESKEKKRKRSEAEDTNPKPKKKTSNNVTSHSGNEPAITLQKEKQTLPTKD